MTSIIGEVAITLSGSLAVSLIAKATMPFFVSLYLMRMPINWLRWPSA